MDPSGDLIAECILSTFNSLPKKFKPQARHGNVKEWTVLSGIVLSYGGDDDAKNLQCVSLSTGLKCLSIDKLIRANGNVLHDCHSEILTTRTFNRFLIDECIKIISEQDHLDSNILEKQVSTDGVQPLYPFKMKDNVKIHMYTSEAPCGDFSMELIINKQKDKTPWNKPINEMLGRGDFSKLGVVRRKPSRADAFQTLSKSCTDKLTLYQYVSLLRSLTSLIIDPKNVYLTSLVVHKNQFIEESYIRSFTKEGRLKDIDTTNIDQYHFKPFQIKLTDKQFEYSRDSDEQSKLNYVSSSKCFIYTASFQQFIHNGILIGRKPFDPLGATNISRRSLWNNVNEILRQCHFQEQSNENTTYKMIKLDSRLNSRRLMKQKVVEQLKGWEYNSGDDNFTLS